ncbi:hypothetical protein AB0K16_19615 [Nonomuraea jabiensis]|uniref:hypothetical protein n=1 Tax=Nonomuraea jabiensis TaxID=882448 RepID=UPI003443F9A4
MTKNLPAALWGGDLSPELNATQLVEGLLVGYLITAKPAPLPPVLGLPPLFAPVISAIFRCVACSLMSGSLPWDGAFFREPVVGTRDESARPAVTSGPELDSEWPGNWSAEGPTLGSAGPATANTVPPAGLSPCH